MIKTVQDLIIELQNWNDDTLIFNAFGESSETTLPSDSCNFELLKASFTVLRLPLLAQSINIYCNSMILE